MQNPKTANNKTMNRRTGLGVFGAVELLGRFAVIVSVIRLNPCTTLSD